MSASSILQLTPLSDHRFGVDNHGDPAVSNVVFGGQLLAQMIMVAARQNDDQHVKTISAVFARAARIDAPTEVDVETINAGRTFSSYTLSVRQGDRLCTRAQVLTTVDEPDLIAHQPDRPELSPPADDAPRRVGGLAFPGAEYVIVDDIDVNDSTADPRPPILDMWYRSVDTPTERAIDQAVLAWATDGFLIGTAMLPHAGVGQDKAHVSINTGVVGHTLTFHRPFSLSDWALIRHEALVACGGRSYGRCNVFDPTGSLVASYVQDSMIRPMSA